MPNFNATAEVYCDGVNSVGKFQPIPQRKPIHSGTIEECVRWVMKHHQGSDLYGLAIPLEAGFQTNDLRYRDIEAISKRPDFPKA
jgi:hypothetical protein